MCAREFLSVLPKHRTNMFHYCGMCRTDVGALKQAKKDLEAELHEVRTRSFDMERRLMRLELSLEEKGTRIRGLEEDLKDRDLEISRTERNR